MQTPLRRQRSADQVRTLRHVKGPADCRTLGGWFRCEAARHRVAFAEAERLACRDRFDRRSDAEPATARAAA